MNRSKVSSKAFDLAVVIPALNERENLELLLPAVNKILDELRLRAEVLVVDGGSDDGTVDVAHKNGARAITQREVGYGGALLTGFRESTAPFVITMDADLSHRPVFLAELWHHRGQAELLIASRYVPGGRAEMSPVRRLLSQLLNRTYGRVLALPIKDLSSGFRMYQRRVLSDLCLNARDFDILEEILIRVDAAGWRIREIPFRYMARGSGNSHARLIKFGIAFLRTLIHMWQLRNSVDAADYDYRAYSSPIILQRYWQQTRHRIVLSYLESQDHVLDIGCGTSRIIVDLASSVGFDIDRNKMRWLHWRHRQVVLGNCNDLPFRRQTFNTVINSEVIEHIPRDMSGFKEMWRVLRPGGILILGTPDYGRWLWWVIEWLYGKILPRAYAHQHITHYTRRGLEAQLRSFGFEILDCQYVGFCEMIFKARKPSGTSEFLEG